LLENASNRCHGLGPVPRAVPCAEQGLDLMERKAAALEQLDPTDARYGGGVVEAKATVRPRGRVEELQLFIEVERPDRFPGLARQIPNFQKLLARCFHRFSPWPSGGIIPLRTR